MSIRSLTAKSSLVSGPRSAPATWRRGPEMKGAVSELMRLASFVRTRPRRKRRSHRGDCRLKARRQARKVSIWTDPRPSACTVVDHRARHGELPSKAPEIVLVDEARRLQKRLDYRRS